MARNWNASENPGRRLYRAEKSRQDAPQSPMYLTDGTVYVPLRQLPQRVKEAICEAVEFFNRTHPTMRGV